MDKAYLRHLIGSSRFEITFRYVDPELGIDRQFNFNRNLTETIDIFLTRIVTKVEKVVSKKSKKKKKKNEAIEEVVEKKPDVCLLIESTEVVRDAICSDVFLSGKNIILKVESTNFEIVVNSPWIDAVLLPASILATFPVYPSKFETVFTDTELSKFVWSKSKDKKVWVDIAIDYICTPSNEEIDHYLKLSCTPKNSLCEGPCTEVVAECKVEASPGRCPFDNRHEFTKTRTNGNE